MLIIEAGEFWSKELTQCFKYLCSWNVAYTTKEKWFSRFQNTCNSYLLPCCKRENYIQLQLGSVSSMFPRPLSVYLIKNGGAPDPNMHLNVTTRGETNLRIYFLSNPRILDLSTRYKFFPYWNLVTGCWFTHFLNLAIQIFTSRLSMIIRVNVVLNRTVVDNDWRFDNLCGNHLQSQIFTTTGWGSTWRDEQQSSRTKKRSRHKINHDIKSKSKNLIY